MTVIDIGTVTFVCGIIFVMFGGTFYVLYRNDKHE